MIFKQVSSSAIGQETDRPTPFMPLYANIAVSGMNVSAY